MPDAAVVLLPIGSASHWNFCGTAVEVLLLNTEAIKSCGCEFLPVADVATPVAGKVKIPRTVPAPLTSRAVPGVDVLMPILAVAPLPVWVSAEF